MNTGKERLFITVQCIVAPIPHQITLTKIVNIHLCGKGLLINETEAHKRKKAANGPNINATHWLNPLRALKSLS
jgi:hypothetical protein